MTTLVQSVPVLLSLRTIRTVHVTLVTVLPGLIQHGRMVAIHGTLRVLSKTVLQILLDTQLVFVTWVGVLLVDWILCGTMALINGTTLVPRLTVLPTLMVTLLAFAM
jgi:hypothetical protein